MLSFIERVGYGTHADLSMFGEEGVGLMRPSDLLVIEWVFLQNRNLRHIVEVGTGCGMSTLYFSQIARMREGDVHTWDIKPPHQKYWDLWPSLTHFHQADVLTSPCEELIPFIQRRDTFVLLDDGDKPREMELYARYLAMGSVLAVHDWNSEVAPKCDPGAIMAEAGLTPYLAEESVEWQSQIRCWRRFPPAG